MRPDFIPFALPDIGEDEIAEVVDSLRTGWITSGPKTQRFEQDMAAFLGGSLYCVAVSSATAALHIALEAVGIRAEDEVITTTHTFTGTAEVISHFGAHPRFVDINPATLCIDPRAVEAAITPRTRAVLPVHYGGMSCDMDAILAIAARHKLRVIEDAAHAIPATYHGKLIGTLGSDATVFSFYATKPVATGEGGMLITRDPALAKRARIMRLHGIDRDAFDRHTAGCSSWRYDVVAPGYNYSLSDLAASLGIHQLRRAWELHKGRTAIAGRYDAAFRDLPVQLPPRPQNADLHAWHLYVVRLNPDAPVDRDTFIQRLNDAGVGCSVHYIPLHLQKYWRETYSLRAEEFPHSQSAYERAVSLPIYTRMTEKQQEQVVATVRSILKRG